MPIPRTDPRQTTPSIHPPTQPLLAQTKVLEQLGSSNDAADGAGVALLDLALLRPGLALLLYAVPAARRSRSLSLAVVDARNAKAGLRCVHLAYVGGFLWNGAPVQRHG